VDDKILPGRRETARLKHHSKMLLAQAITWPEEGSQSVTKDEDSLEQGLVRIFRDVKVRMGRKTSLRY